MMTVRWWVGKLCHGSRDSVGIELLNCGIMIKNSTYLVLNITTRCVIHVWVNAVILSMKIISKIFNRVATAMQK